MRSDPTRPGRPAEALARVLAEAAGGERLSAAEVAELLWLAGHMATPSAPGPPVDVRRPAAPEAPDAPEHGAPDPGRPAPSADEALADGRVPLHLATEASEPSPWQTNAASPTGTSAPARPSPPPTDDGTRLLRVPVPPMVRHPLALQRALRPLKRRVPSPSGQVLDEEATAHRIARLGARPDGWLPVMRPARERWLRLCLVYDTGTTMPMWRPLVHELHTAFAQSGVFRTVELHGAHPDGTVPPQAASPPADGRTVTLLISDCMGPQWREGAPGERWYRTLRRWAERMPLAVVQPLPERLWRTTALPTEPGLLCAPRAGAPASALRFTPYDAGRRPGADAVPLPVLEPTATWLSHWASLVADPGGARLPGAVAWLGHTPTPVDPAEREDVALLSAEEIVLRFRSTASPEAFRLAGHLAMGTPHLPVMRLVHAAVEERPRPQHLAEVILSGMLSGTPEGPPGAYAFRDGVRDVLLRSLPRTARGRTRQFLAQVGGLIDDRAGAAPGELRAGARAVGGPHRAVGTDEPALEAEPFATVSQESVRRLGGASGLLAGRYRLDRQVGPDSSRWLARDSWQDDESVLVQTYPQPTQWPKVTFTGIAHRLTQVRHPHVAAVRDYGIEGETPYLVSDFVDGRTLDRLIGRSPDRLPDAQLLSLIAPLAAAVTALHEDGIAHGAVHTSNVVVTPLGPLLTGVGIKAFGATSREEDLRDLGHLIREMYGGTWYPSSRQLSLPSGDLGLPGELRWTLRDAIGDLVSDDPDAQLRGAERLSRLDPEPDYERRYSLLGPLAVRHDGRPLATGSRQEQALLCMLLLRERGVTYNELIDGLWGPDAPKDARRLIGTYASRLRNALGPDSVRAAGSHALLLRSDPDDVDLFRCRRLAAHAEEARRDGDTENAFHLVQSALDLWYGDPLENVPGPAAEAARADIRSLHQSLVRLQRELAQNQAGSEPVPAELDELLQEFPHADDEVLAPHETLQAVDLASLDTEQGQSEASTPTRTGLTFDFTTRPVPDSALRNLGEVVSRFLVRGGIGPDRFTLSPRLHGWDVAVAAEVHPLQALTVVLHQLPHMLGELTPLGLGVTVTPDPDRAAPVAAFPAERRRLLSGTSTRQAVVIIPDDLHDDLVRSGRLPTARFEQVPQSDDWYHAIAAPTPRLTSWNAVILGFDGTLAHLYPGHAARDAARSLAAVIAEQRSPASAEAGEPLLPGGGHAGLADGRIHPLDVLRAFARHPSLPQELHTHLERIEVKAAPTARPPGSVANVLRALTENNPHVAIATDVSPGAVTTYLRARGIPFPETAVHGRTADLTRLMPDPDCLRRALDRLGSPADRCVMIGSSSVEADAARSLDMAFIGIAPDSRSRERLLAAGARSTCGLLSDVPGALRNA
ncbi:SAV_2336 N-terminal domain-related protein [Streptomyces sp. NPDC041068]|uniref:SAV_2336 N-terminal domain-related protein n=1 Tax=Streptomyces sp. NPDC041068 TaxID=3155130 RepID=UPI0033FB9027